MLLRKALFTLVFALATFTGYATNELNCQVELVFDRVQTVDPIVFKTLENAINEFMNGKKWTNDNYKENERIECSILINITDELGGDKYKAQVTIQSSRKAFNSTYNSVMLNMSDGDWIFEYAQFQPLEYAENVYISNLTSMLAYYAYVIIGLDYDSYSMQGGQPYFQKAENIINAVPPNSSDAPGWRPFDGNGQVNRYWLIENLLGPEYRPLREMLYQYHLQGLDQMSSKPKVARVVMISALQKLEPVAKQNPNAMILRTFFAAKSNELVQIFSTANTNEKTEAVNLLRILDPANSAKYLKILKK